MDEYQLLQQTDYFNCPCSTKHESFMISGKFTFRLWRQESLGGGIGLCHSIYQIQHRFI